METRLRIAFLLDRIRLGGTERQFLAIAKGLQDEGHEIHVGVLYPPAATDDIAWNWATSLGLEITVLGSARRDLQQRTSWLNVVSAPLSAYRVSQWLRKVDPQLLHAAMSRSMYLAASLTYFPWAPPVVMSRRELVSNVRSLPGRRHLGKWALKRGDLIIANSQAVAQDSAAFECQERTRYRVIYNACLISETSNDEAQENETHSPRVYMIANLRPQKGHMTALTAAALLAEGGTHVELVFIGGGPLEDDLRKRAADLGVNVTFMGVVPDPSHLIAPRALVLQASETEGFSNALLEAMERGAAIVATAVGGTQEALGNAGILIEPGDQVGMADGILRLIRDPHLRSSFAERARDRASEFSLGRSVQEHQMVYQEVTGLGEGEAHHQPE